MHLQKKYKVVIIIAITFLLILLIVNFWAGGSFGVRPSTNGCLGIPIRYKTVLKYFPEGDIGSNSFRYYVPAKNNSTFSNERIFCLGQDVWFGE